MSYFAVRFSDNIEADIVRNWSAWMLPGLAGSYADCEQDIADGYATGEIREFPEYPGCYGVVHHEGLSCYVIDAENAEGAVTEARRRSASCELNGSGYGERTIGKVVLVATISKQELGTVRDMHILEIEDYGTEL